MSYDKKIVISVMLGIAAFGATMWAIKMLPSGNVITDTVKKVANIAAE